MVEPECLTEFSDLSSDKSPHLSRSQFPISSVRVLTPVIPTSESYLEDEIKQ